MPTFARTLEHLLGRLDGPLHFRFIFQPLMAIIFAIRDGRRDARAGHPPYRLITHPERRREVLRTTWKGVGKVFVIAIILDVVYEIIELGHFYLLQTLTVALVLAVIPYALVRSPANLLTRRFSKSALAKKSPGE